MKLMIALMSLVMISSSFAQGFWAEINCENRFSDDPKIELIVNYHLLGGQSTYADLIITSQEGIEDETFFVHSRVQPMWNRVTVEGANFYLDISIWPDRLPNRFWQYNATLRTDMVNGGMPFDDLVCDFR